MSDYDAYKDQKGATLNELSRVINSTEERDAEFWESMLQSARANFERGLESIRETRNTVIELIKIDILILSAYIATFQYLGPELSQNTPTSAYFSPFLLLFSSFAIFIHSYFSMGSHIVGEGSGILHKTLSNGDTYKDYCRTMSVVYYKWADKNNYVTVKVGKWNTCGISAIFASLGALAIILLL
jgi:hypothetical protein